MARAKKSGESRKIGSRRRFGVSLWQAQHAIERAMTEALKPLDITFSQVNALTEIEAEPGISGAELARRLGLTAQSTGTLVTQLESAGWVQRSPHPSHKRVIETRITDQGSLALGTALGIVAEVDSAVTSHVTKAARLSMAEVLDQCRAAAEARLNR